MQDTVNSSQRVRFGAFEVDLRAGELWKSGRKRKLTGQPFAVLAILLEKPGEVVSREELQKRLWPDTFVDVDHNLNTAINKIREALDDSSEHPRFVETLSRRGYRFIAPVESVQPEQPIPNEAGSVSSVVAAEGQGFRSRWLWSAAAGAAVLLAAAFVGWWRIPRAVPVIDSITQLTYDNEPKTGRLASDGSRIYFNVGPKEGWKIAEVSVSGGRSALIDTGVANAYIVGLAADGSALLALDQPDPNVYQHPSAWSIPLPAGEPRLLSNANVQGAAFFPDARVLLVIGTDLYVADSDGSNLRKLASFPGEVVSFPSVSPDGKQIVLAKTDARGTNSWVELAADGTGLRTIVDASQDQRFGPGVWSADGNYFVYRMGRALGSDIWVLSMQTGIFHRSRQPIRLTNGTLLYSSVCLSRDGKQLFAIGTKPRGEVVRYDVKSQQFVPFLSGISAIDPNFSRDGEWVAYSSYPDHSLWRSRSDGTERRQLTYPPMAVGYPFISPDGTKVAFINSGGTYVVSMDGGLPQRIVEKNSVVANWSPDGNLLVVMRWTEAPEGKKNRAYLQIFDSRTGKLSLVPDSLGIGGAIWITQNSLVAMTETGTKFVTFDFKTQKWSDLLIGKFTNWNLSPDRKYFYFTTGGAYAKVQRLRFADRQIETIASLKDLHRVEDTAEESRTQIDVAPDGSPVFTRDIGSQEIYALNVKFP